MSEEEAWLEGARFAWKEAAAKVDRYALPVFFPSDLPKHIRRRNPHRKGRST